MQRRLFALVLGLGLTVAGAYTLVVGTGDDVGHALGWILGGCLVASGIAVVVLSQLRPRRQ